jgi:hypothetical protein
VAGEKVEDGGLAGAVGADDSKDLPLPQAQPVAFNGVQSLEGFREAVYFEQKFLRRSQSRDFRLFV